jgi:hypothetical protein
MDSTQIQMEDPLAVETRLHQEAQTQAYQYEEPQVYTQQPQAYAPQAYEEPQVYTQQPQAYAPQAYEETYEEQAYEEVYEEPVAQIQSGPKKKKLKGGKTKVNLSAATSRSSAASGRRSAASGRAQAEEMDATSVDEEPTRRGGRSRRTLKKEKVQKKSNKGLIIGVAIGAILLIVIIAVVALGGGKKAPETATSTETATTETAVDAVKEEVKKPEEPKEVLIATGAFNEDAFKVKVLAFINGGQFEQADLWLKSRPKDAPHEDLTFLKGRLEKARSK